jgi:hypothetical protein
MGLCKLMKNFRPHSEEFYAIGAVRAGYRGHLLDAIHEAEVAAIHVAAHLGL